MEWRTGKQCRERYINQLDPNIKKTPWTFEEDAVIKRLHDQLGKKWSKFMDLLPGRSDNAIKNRWHVISRDNYAEHLNRSLYTFQNVHRSPAVKSADTEDSNAIRMARCRVDCGNTHQERMTAVKEELLDSVDCTLIALDSTDIDLDLCSFSEDCGGEIAPPNKQKAKQQDGGSTSSSMSPRTTNDLAEGNDEDPNTMSMGNSFNEYIYSASTSYHSNHSAGELSSGRDSPIDFALLTDLLTTSKSGSIKCNPTAALPATPDTSNTGNTPSSTSVATPVSPNAVAAVASSPKAKPGSPKDLKIQTNNSLYDFDYYFARKPSDAPVMEPVLRAGSLDPTATEAEPDEKVCWNYDPNEDLAMALECLMSAAPSPAAASAPATGIAAPTENSRRNSNAAQAQLKRFSSSGSMDQNEPSRSPNSSWFALLDSSPAGSQRIRPYSGNAASVASMLVRSNSSISSSTRLAGDPEVERLPVPVGPVLPATVVPIPVVQPALATRPLPAPPVNAAPTASSSTAREVAWQMPLQRAVYQQQQRQQEQSSMPEHSPMNHTHFSPACPNSKRSRSKNPATFSW